MTNLDALKHRLGELLESDSSKKDLRDNIENLLDNGAIVKCPKCKHKSYLYHLQWAALICENCGGKVKRKHIII